MEKYVSNCAWARDKGLLVDPSQILCESYRDKTGSQRLFQMGPNPMQLVSGRDFSKKKKKVEIFDEVVEFAKFSEYLIVAEVRRLVSPEFSKYKDNLILPEGLDHFEEEEQITHEIRLKEDLKVEESLRTYPIS